MTPPVAAGPGRPPLGRPLLLDCTEVRHEQHAALLKLRPSSRGGTSTPGRTTARLRDAERLAEGARARVQALRRSIADLEQGRLDAAEAVSSLTRPQVSEVRQLARNPPEIIRRTLSAAWILLHCRRFAGKPVVTFDERKMWPVLQRMLADEDFVRGVMCLEPAQLAELPQVTSYVATTYLGLQHQAAAGETPMAASLSAPVGAPTERPASRGGAAMGRSASASGGLPRPRRWWDVALPKQPLSVATVGRASEPCGRLLLWMIRLVQEAMDYRRLRAELEAAEQELDTLDSKVQRLRPPPSVTVPKLVLPPPPAEEPPPSSRIPEPRLQSARKVVAAVLPALPAPPPLPKVEPEVPPEPPSARQEEPLPKVQLHVTGGLECLRQQLNKLKVPFGFKESDIDESDASQKQMLRGLQRILKDNRGRLKLRLLGCREFGELPYVALARAQAVASALAEAMSCDTAITGHGLLPRGWLRAEGGPESGRCVVAVPLKELVPLYGPICREVACYSAPVGLYFGARDAVLQREALAIVREMAAFLKAAGSHCCIEGHVDRSEPAEYADRRAYVVAAELIKLGVPATRIQRRGRNAMCPLSRHSVPNRRVEVYLSD